MMQREWKVGELAKMAGLTIRTLRYYDQIGLFSPSAHTDAGYRLYNERDLARLQQILSLKELGLSLEQMKSVLAGDRVGLLEIVSLQISRLKENIRRQEKLMRELESVSSRMRRNESLSVEHFARLMQAMRMNHETYLDELQSGWNLHLDQLGAYLDDHSGDPGKPDN